MTIQELLKLMPGGHLTWKEGPHANEPEPYENLRMNLDQLDCIHIEYQGPDGEWHEWESGRFEGKPVSMFNRSDTEFLNALISAVLGLSNRKRAKQYCVRGNDNCKQIGCDCYKSHWREGE